MLRLQIFALVVLAGLIALQARQSLTNMISMSPPQPRAIWNSIVAALLLLALGVTGCSSAGSVQDVQLRARGNTLYLLARSGNVSRNLCASLGLDVARAESRSAALEGRTIHLDRAVGCYTVHHVIVCPEEDAACIAHEEHHRLAGAFHR